MFHNPTSRGLRLSILDRGDFDRTLSVSRGCRSVVLVGICDRTGTSERLANRTVVPILERMQSHTASDDSPAMALVVTHLFGDTSQPHLTVMPVVVEDGTTRLVGDTYGPAMASGAYVVGDSNYARLIRGAANLNHAYPIPLHDWVESWSQYRAQTRMD